MSTTPDVLGLRGTKHNTGGAAMGRVESRSASPSATDDAAALVAALDDLDEELTDDVVLQVGRELGFTPKRTEAAARSALRAGLVIWYDD